MVVGSVRNRSVVVTALGIVLAAGVALAGGGLVKSAIFSDGKAVMASAGSVIVSPAAFSVYDVPSGVVFEENNGKLWVSGCAMAPVDLPYGVTITSLSTSLWDNNDPQNVSLTLYRSQMTNPGGQIVAEITSSGQGAIWFPYFDFFPDVRYTLADTGYVFYILVCAAGSDNGIGGALITYN